MPTGLHGKGKIMKKILSILIVVILMIALVSCGYEISIQKKTTDQVGSNNSKDDIIHESEGLGFALNDDSKSYCVTGIGTCTDTDIVIPSTHNGLPVTRIDSYAFQARTSITSIVIPDSITSIGDSVFYGCTSLTSVDIGDSVTSIDYFTFSLCTSLASIEVDVNNQYYKSIDGNLYSKDGKTLIKYAIGKEAELFCVPDSVMSIGSYAFMHSTTLTSVEVPYSVTSIGERAFSWCTSLKSIEVDTRNQYYKSIDGNLYTKDGTTLIRYTSAQETTLFRIPDSVISIGDSAFIGCTYITNIEIPDSVTGVGYMAFYGCTSLKNIRIGNSLTSIGVWAFGGCTSLASINFAGTVDQWNSIFKNFQWLDGFPTNGIVCSDGVVTTE